MEGILVRKEITPLYNSLIADYCTGDYDNVGRYVIVMSNDKKELDVMLATDYMEIYTQKEGNHKVYDVVEWANEGI